MSEQVRVPAQRIYCPGCGSPGPAGALACGACGANLRGIGGPVELLPAPAGAYAIAPAQPLLLPDPVTTLMPHLTEGHQARIWQVLIGGGLLFLALQAFYEATGNVLLIPSIIIATSFLLPVVFVLYLAKVNALGDTPGGILLVIFGLGGLMGVLAALLLYRLVPAEGWIPPGFVNGLVEEIAKPLPVLWLLARRRYRFELDGLVFGAAAGMGFNAFEDAGYAFRLFLENFAAAAGTGGVQAAAQAAFDAFYAQTLFRAVLGPFSHGLWTAIVCAGLWRARGSGRATLGLPALLTFAIAVLLHGLWDTPLGGLWARLGIPTSGPWIKLVVLSVAGLWVLRWSVHRGLREQADATIAPQPLASSPAAFARARDATALTALGLIACPGCGSGCAPGVSYCGACGGGCGGRIGA